MTERYEVFSIIMPCYNAGSYISSSISSVINQTYPHWCLYIIDDGSTDHSYEIIHTFMSSESRIKYIKLPHNSGVAMARNRGIKEVNGNYIAFLDSDDLWMDRKLELQLYFLESGYDIVCSNYMTFTDVISSSLSERFFPEKFNYRDMLFGNKIGNLTGVYNQVNLGKCYQHKKGHEDYIMWLDLMKRTKYAYCVQDVLAYYRVASTSLSSNKWRASRWQWEIYRRHLGFGVFSSCCYWACYLINALKR